MPNIPANKINLIEKNFKLVDDDNDNLIDENEFKRLLRIIGQTKTEKELNKIIETSFENNDDDKNKEENKKENENKNDAKSTSMKNGNQKMNTTKSDSQKTNEIKRPKFSASIISKDAKNTTDKKEIKSTKKPINFESFLKIFQDVYKEPISLDELVKSFQIFDNENKGYINLDKLKTILKSGEEKLNDEDIEYFLNSTNLKNKKEIDYVKLSKTLKTTL